jgi:hypothetical protein
MLRAVFLNFQNKKTLFSPNSLNVCWDRLGEKFSSNRLKLLNFHTRAWRGFLENGGKSVARQRNKI